MRERGYTDKSFQKHLNRYDSVAPKFYGLPKIHKAGNPFRPVISFVRAPTYSLSQFLASILKNLGNYDMNVRSSQKFREMVWDMELDHDCIMVSFDAISLFTTYLFLSP